MSISATAFSSKLLTLFDESGKLRPPSAKKATVTKRLSDHPETVRPYAISEPDTSSDDDSPFKPYAKPDSDPEDEDDDPTLINRDKAKPPVYIASLVKGLQETENYDVQRLALTAAASLIRRKANFGSELRDEAEELATALTGLKDNFEMDSFQEMRLQAMIALLVALPDRIGPWFARTLFQGDYSIAQRSTVLVTIGFGARELAGYSKENSKRTDAEKLIDLFPSKQLPTKLHKLYAPQQASIDRLVSGLQRAMIEPKARAAADKLTGLDSLKVRTFSSRMRTDKQRAKPVENSSSSVIATSVFFPLTSGWYTNLKSYGSKGVHFEPFLLTSFIKTLALILHAAGPTCPYLQQMTSEMWDLLLSLRTQSETPVLEALLFAMLTLLEVNERKERLAEQHSRELLETQEWASQLFDSASAASAGQDDENERLKMLTASVLLHTRDVVQSYEKRLAGQMMA